MRTGLVLAIPSLLASASLARAEMSCGDLLVVYDRSGSMVNCRIGTPSPSNTKESIARSVLKDISYKNAQVPMGLIPFPDTLTSCPEIPSDGACAPGKVAIEIAPDGADRIFRWLDTMPRSCGGTPTGRTMETARDYAGWSPGKTHFVLLITDGGPTCDDGLEGGTSDASSGMCKDDPAGTPCNGQGSCECKNPTKAYESIMSLRARGIDTFVVGFEGTCYGAPPGSPPPYDPNILNKMAELGGQAQSGSVKYYPAMDKDTLAAALGKILGKVSGATVGGCGKGGGGSGGGGAGGSGGGSDGAAGSGGSGGAPKDADNGGNADGGGGPGGNGRMQPGCACRTPADGAGPSAAVWLIAALGAAARLRRRTGD